MLYLLSMSYLLLLGSSVLGSPLVNISTEELLEVFRQEAGDTTNPEIFCTEVPNPTKDGDAVRVNKSATIKFIWVDSTEKPCPTALLKISLFEKFPIGDRVLRTVTISKNSNVRGVFYGGLTLNQEYTAEVEAYTDKGKSQPIKYEIGKGTGQSENGRPKFSSPNFELQTQCDNGGKITEHRASDLTATTAKVAFEWAPDEAEKGCYTVIHSGLKVKTESKHNSLSASISNHFRGLIYDKLVTKTSYTEETLSRGKNGDSPKSPAEFTTT